MLSIESVGKFFLSSRKMQWRTFSSSHCQRICDNKTRYSNLTVTHCKHLRQMPHFFFHIHNQHTVKSFVHFVPSNGTVVIETVIVHSVNPLAKTLLCIKISSRSASLKLVPITPKKSVWNPTITNTRDFNFSFSLKWTSAAFAGMAWS